MLRCLCWLGCPVCKLCCLRCSFCSAVFLLFLPLPVSAHPLHQMSTEMEARISRIEDGLSEWTATTRTRWEGLTTLNQRMCDLYKNKGGMWHVKKELFDLVFNDLDHALGSMEDIARQTQIRSELRGILTSQKELIGVFPVGGDWGQNTAVDIRFRPSLIAMRLSDLVRSTLRPFLTQLNGPVKCWVPLSQGEMSRRRKRKGLGSTKGDKGHGKGKGKDHAKVRGDARRKSPKRERSRARR